MSENAKSVRGQFLFVIVLCLFVIVLAFSVSTCSSFFGGGEIQAYGTVDFVGPHEYGLQVTISYTDNNGVEQQVTGYKDFSAPIHEDDSGCFTFIPTRNKNLGTLTDYKPGPCRW
ncbi:hypothetical protein COY32_03975 [candidate division WWE3 bacterium CG_4_10_14_0_2_um_filter_41_14]|uniref:Uncharacterized protein n=1 Tax=candidate division WWE3 bacterium CG_4_10_14_0_2_um_filter_41_14 TaxID=1975072 RepID=A0A2M7TIA6_UNCKA|nr:MAG: hypothetical protein COY32_03975 [candidate division WWE3 bacterium CG_4_10_14_0_2_um_filter_41_14]